VINERKLRKVDLSLCAFQKIRAVTEGEMEGSN